MKEIRSSNRHKAVCIGGFVQEPQLMQDRIQMRCGMNHRILFPDEATVTKQIDALCCIRRGATFGASCLQKATAFYYDGLALVAR